MLDEPGGCDHDHSHDHADAPEQAASSSSKTRSTIYRWAMRLLVGVPLLHAIYHPIAMSMGWPCP